MATQLDERIFYLKLEYGLTELQINNIVNEIIANNDELLANTKDRDGLIYDLVVARLTGTAKDIGANNKGKEFDVLVVTHPDVIQNIDGSTFTSYVGLKAISNFEGVTLEEYNNYIQKRGAQQALLDFMEEAKKDFPDGKIPAPSTVKKHIKKLIDNKIPLIKVENYNGKVYYKLLNCIENKETGKPNYFVTIPYEKVRELVISTNNNMMKLYAIMCYATNETEYKPITRKWLAEKMGLSTISDNNIKAIGTMLTSLCNLGFLECLEEVSISPDGNEYKTIHKYRITTLNEYREAKRRGKHRKIVK